MELQTDKNYLKIAFPQYIFILGIFAKQFYFLPSGSFQIGDLLMMLGCITYLVLSKKGVIRVDTKDSLIYIYSLFTIIINLLYYFVLNDKSFIKPILYYFYNTVIILFFSAFLADSNSVAFLNILCKVLKASLIVQLAVLVSGYGMWAYNATRYCGTFNDPNQYSVFIFFSLLLVFVIDHITNNRRWVWWCLLGTALILPSTSTGTMVGLIVFWSLLYLTSVKRLNNSERLLWGVVLLGFVFIYIILYMGIFQVPGFIASSRMYRRFFSKAYRVISASDMSFLFADRGWTRIINNPVYFLYGAGEGGFSRFNTSIEIHSSIIGPFFCYGIIPSALLWMWIIRQLRFNKYLFVFVSMLAEAFFLVNTRQPMYWMILVLAGYPALKKSSED